MAEADYRAVLDVVHAVGEATTREEFAAVSIAGLGPLVRSEVTTFNEVDPVMGRVVYSTEPESYVFPAATVVAFAELADRHPLIRHHAESRDGSALKISDLLDPEGWHRSEIYRRFFAQLGLEHQMSITLPAPLPIVVGIAVNRAREDFDERDRAVLNLARPHLAQSWRRAREYERVEGLLSATTAVLTGTGSGAIALTDPLQELTSDALVSLYRFFGRPAPRDPLPARVRHWLDVHRGDGTPIELSRPLRARLEGRQLVLRYLPGLNGQPDVILLDEAAVDAPSDTLRALGLSEREVAVLRLVSTGASNADIASRLSISHWTVKRHLANSYAKLGVRNRAGAVTHLLEIEAHHQQ